MLLADALRPLEDAEEIKALATRLLGQRLGAARVIYFEVEGASYVIERDYTEHLVSLSGRYPVASFGTALLETFRAGRTAVEPDCWQNPDVTAELRPAFDAVQVRAYVGVPLVKAGVFVAGLSVNHTQPRQWSSSEIAVIEETAERTWAAVERARTTKQLQASERLRRVALEAAGLGVWSLDPVSLVLTTDERFRAILWGSTDALTYDAAINSLHPDDRQRVLDAMAAALRLVDPVPYSESYRVIWPDGTQRWVFATGRGHVVNGPQAPFLESFDGTIQDITEQKRAQAQTNENEARAGLLFNSMGEGAFIIEMILDGQGRPEDYRFLHVNPAFERHSGLTGAVGKSARQLVPDLEQHWIDFYGRVALTGEPGKIQQTGDSMGGRWWDVSAYRLGGHDSLRVAALFSDITERVKNEAIKAAAEHRARQAYGLLRAVADGSRDAIAAVDTELCFTFVNNTYQSNFYSLFGVHALIGGSLEETMAHSPQDQGQTLNVWRRALCGERFVLDVDFGDSAKGGRSWKIFSYPLLDLDGCVIGAAQNAVDITQQIAATSERERLLGQLQAQDQRKNEFLAMLSHELRNPLAPISNAVQLLRRQAGNDSKQLQPVALIDRQVVQLKRMVDELLEVSRITTGRIQLRQDRITLGSIVNSAIETTGPLLETRRHEMVVSLPAEPIWLDADAARLEQVLVNLLVNAAKYSDPGCRISIVATKEGQEAVLRVQDTGSGIAPELLPHVFDLFTQAERSLARSEGGLGIGLALVKRLVELHGGSVEALSTPGRGSEFVVRLPAATAGVTGNTPSAPGVLPAKGAAAPGAKHRVLVVDDNVDAAESLSELLQVCGYDARAVHDGLSALNAATQWQPRVVLLDIGLPEMDGYEVARRVRLHPELAPMVLVALTGYGQDADIQQAMAAGFDHHLTKPADFTKIQEILAGL